jgi:hypothetical protein
LRSTALSRQRIGESIKRIARAGFQISDGSDLSGLARDDLIFPNAFVPDFQEPKHEVFEQTYEIDPQAGLSIRNIDGSIVIHGTETATLKLRAIKKANSSEELKGIDITAIAEGKSVSITPNRFIEG